MIYNIRPKLTRDNNKIGFLPYTSDVAPTTGEAKNWRKENRDPMNPEIYQNKIEKIIIYKTTN